MIGFARTIDSSQVVIPEFNDTEEEENEALQKDKTRILNEEKENNVNSFDLIGDIEKKLESAGCAYYTSTVESKQKESIDPSPDPFLKRTIMPLYQRFRSELADKNKKINLREYPHRKRFNVFVDRRNYTNDKKWKDKITIFEPPSNCDTIPNEHISEVFYQSSRHCLIPNKGIIIYKYQANLYKIYIF